MDKKKRADGFAEFFFLRISSGFLMADFMLAV
jgi:hypothetical protein